MSRICYRFTSHSNTILHTEYRMNIHSNIVIKCRFVCEYAGVIFVYALSQWETTLRSNVASHWLNTYTIRSLNTIMSHLHKNVHCCRGGTRSDNCTALVPSPYCRCVHSHHWNDHNWGGGDLQHKWWRHNMETLSVLLALLVVVMGVGIHGLPMDSPHKQ